MLFLLLLLCFGFLFLTKLPNNTCVNLLYLQEELEEKLDMVEKELGTLRMSLKRCNVLKISA